MTPGTNWPTWIQILFAIWVILVVISFGGWLFKINDEQFEKEEKLDEDAKKREERLKKYGLKEVKDGEHFIELDSSQPDINTVVNNLNQLNAYNAYNQWLLNHPVDESIESKSIKTIIQASNERQMKWSISTMNDKHDYVLKVKGKYVTDWKTSYSDELGRTHIHSYQVSEYGPINILRVTQEEAIQLANDISSDCYALRVDIRPGITFADPTVLKG